MLRAVTISSRSRCTLLPAPAHPTLQTIGDAVVQDGLLTREALDALIDELYALAGDPRSVIGLPRIVQTWGRRPAVEATRA